MFDLEMGQKTLRVVRSSRNWIVPSMGNPGTVYTMVLLLILRASFMVEQ